MKHVEFMGQIPSQLRATANRTLGLKVKVGTTFLTITTLALGTCLSLLYFVQINFIAQKGLTINQLEQKIADTKRENRLLSNDIAELNSLGFTKQVASQQLHMEEISKVEYWQSSGSKIVAQK
ncbi:MAG: hypothetical protein WCP97_01895 [bacterium]